MDQITNPQPEFDLLLKMDIFRAVLYGVQAGSTKRSTASMRAIANRDPALVHLAVAPGNRGERHRLQAFCEPRVTTHTVPLRHDNIGN